MCDHHTFELALFDFKRIVAVHMRDCQFGRTCSLFMLTSRLPRVSKVNETSFGLPGPACAFTYHLQFHSSLLLDLATAPVLSLLPSPYIILYTA